MKEKLILGVKGFLIGIANIIPGVSGGTLAITLGIYEQLIKAISHFFKNWKENLSFLIPIGIGMVLSVLILSNVISYSLEVFPVATTLFFVGLIAGGLPMLIGKTKSEKKNVSHVFIFILAFLLIALFAFLKEGEHVVEFTNFSIGGYLLLFLIGALASATMVIPGMSGSFVLMLIGYYQPILETIRNLTHFQNIVSNLLILIPFGLGILVGIILIAKLIEYLLQKFEGKTYFAIIGFVVASILVLIYGLFAYSVSILEIGIGIVTFLIGSMIAYQLGEK